MLVGEHAMKLGVTLPLSDIGGEPAAVRLFAQGGGDEASWREEFKFWKSVGVTRVTLNSAYQRNHHQRIASRSLQAL
jgi:hypothetical protein